MRGRVNAAAALLFAGTTTGRVLISLDTGYNLHDTQTSIILLYMRLTVHAVCNGVV
jgi:hypothetical protein